MKTSTAAVIAAVVLGLLGIIAWMQSQQLDVSGYVVVIPSVVASVAALFGVTQVSKTTDTIKTNTNGNLTKANADKTASDNALMLALAHLTPEQGVAILNTRSAAQSGAQVTVPLVPADLPAPTTAPPAPAPEPSLPALPDMPADA